MAYLQSITMLVIWLGSGGWFRHTSCPPAASRPEPSGRNKLIGTVPLRLCL